VAHFVNPKFTTLTLGSIPEHLAPILQRLDIEGDQWLHSSQHFGSMFYRVAGKVHKMKERALATGQKWVKGIGAGQIAFLSREVRG